MNHYQIIINFLHKMKDPPMISQYLPMILSNLPAAVSPDSIIASVPSYIAFATSVTSALVGLGFLIIESNIWVAVITGFPALLHFAIIIF